MVLGNLAAIVQKSVRRLLAYSAIAQAGYMLVGLLADNPQGLAALIFYALTYAFTILGAFAVVGAVQQAASGDGFAAFAGLRQRAPLLACSMMVFMLSLAGIPPLVGFFGKFYLFTAAVHSAPQNLGLLWLVVLAIAMSAVSLYYYLQVLKQIFVAAAPAGAPSIEVSLSTNILVALLALGALVVGGAPNLLLGRLVALIK
jgi:NADH-quinone oxidoreductase subunit N